MSKKSKVMKKGNETVQRPISLQPGESASVVSPIYPSVVYSSETPDMLMISTKGVFKATHMLEKGIQMQQLLPNR